MRPTLLIVVVIALISIFSADTVGQSDELREAIGLPISNDQPVIYGQVSFRGLNPSEPKPTVHVILMVGGTTVDRMKALGNGYFYFLQSPRSGSMLIFEINELEIGRRMIMAGSGSRLRQDLEVNWLAFRKLKEQRLGNVPAGPQYERSEQNEQVLTKARDELREKKYAFAIKNLLQLTTSDPKDFVAWVELGTAYFGDGKLDEADAAYARSLELQADFLPALVNRGKLQLAQQHFDLAIATLSSAVKADPQSADAHHFLGEAYLQMKQGSKAVGPLNEAIRLAPNEKADIHLRLAALYNAAGAKDRAAAEYKHFLEKVPNYPDKKKLKKYIEENLK